MTGTQTASDRPIKTHQQGARVVLTPHDDLDMAQFTGCWIGGTAVEARQ